MSHPNPSYDPENSLKEDHRGSGLLKPKSKSKALKKAKTVVKKSHYKDGVNRKFGSDSHDSWMGQQERNYSNGY